jgi:hypothetical protein
LFHETWFKTKRSGTSYNHLNYACQLIRLQFLVNLLLIYRYYLQKNISIPVFLSGYCVIITKFYGAKSDIYPLLFFLLGNHLIYVHKQRMTTAVVVLGYCLVHQEVTVVPEQ